MMPHFMAFSQLDGRPENRVVVEGHFDSERDARLQLRYATRQRHGVIALPQDERVEEHGCSKIDELYAELATFEDELKRVEDEAYRIRRRIEDIEAEIAKERKRARP